MSQFIEKYVQWLRLQKALMNLFPRPSYKFRDLEYHRIDALYQGMISVVLLMYCCGLHIVLSCRTVFDSEGFSPCHIKRPNQVLAFKGTASEHVLPEVL